MKWRPYIIFGGKVIGGGGGHFCHVWNFFWMDSYACIYIHIYTPKLCLRTQESILYCSLYCPNSLSLICMALLILSTISCIVCIGIISDSKHFECLIVLGFLRVAIALQLVSMMTVMPRYM